MAINAQHITIAALAVLTGYLAFKDQGRHLNIPSLAFQLNKTTIDETYNTQDCFRVNEAPEVLNCEGGGMHLIEIPHPVDCAQFIYNPEEVKTKVNVTLWDLDTRKLAVVGSSCRGRRTITTCYSNFFGECTTNYYLEDREVTESECKESGLNVQQPPLTYDCSWLRTVNKAHDWVEKTPFYTVIDHQTGEIYVPTTGNLVDYRRGFDKNGSFVVHWGTKDINFDPMCNHIQRVNTTCFLSARESNKLECPSEALVTYVDSGVEIVCDGKRAIQTKFGSYVTIANFMRIRRGEKVMETHAVPLEMSAYVAEGVNHVSLKQAYDEKRAQCERKNILIGSLVDHKTLGPQEIHILTSEKNSIGIVQGRQIMIRNCHRVKVAKVCDCHTENILVEDHLGHPGFYNPWTHVITNQSGASMPSEGRKIHFINGLEFDCDSREHRYETHQIQAKRLITSNKTMTPKMRDYIAQDPTHHEWVNHPDKRSFLDQLQEGTSLFGDLGKYAIIVGIVALALIMLPLFVQILISLLPRRNPYY